MAKKLRINYQEGEECVMLASVDDFYVTLYGVTTIAQKDFAKKAGFVKTGQDIWRKKYKTDDELIAILETIAPDVYFDEEWIVEVGQEQGFEVKYGRRNPANPNYIIVEE